MVVNLCPNPHNMGHIPCNLPPDIAIRKLLLCYVTIVIYSISLCHFLESLYRQHAKVCHEGSKSNKSGGGLERGSGM